MRHVILAVAMLAGSSSFLLATDPAAQQLLVTAKQQASIFQDQAAPLQLEVDFVAQVKVPIHGHLTVKRAARDRWWRKVVMGDFEQIEIRNGDRLYTTRNTSFTPLRVRDLTNLLQFAEASEIPRAKKQKRRAKDGVEVICLTVEWAGFKAEPHEICINSASHDIVSDDWQESPDERRRKQYTDYADFEGHRYPRKLQLTVNGRTLLTAQVESLTKVAFDDAILAPPKGAIERRRCTDMKHAVPISTPDPMYPASARNDRLMGDTTVAMTVLIDGSVTDIQLIGGATHSMDEATLKTLKDWKFKPALCGAEPVVSDIVVVVHFRLY